MNPSFNFMSDAVAASGCVLAGPMSNLFRSTFMRRRVMVTGSNGNLGTKLVQALISTKQYDLFLVDIQPECNFKHTSSIPIVEYIPADLRTQQSTWTRKLRRTDIVVHFATANSQPDASWSDAADSMDMTFNVLLQAAKARVGRVILASSCHVVGGWKEHGGVELKRDASNTLSSQTEPSVGMVYTSGPTLVDSTAYASAYFAAERLASTLAATYPDTAFLAIRIGCCQPGENKSQTLTCEREKNSILVDDDYLLVDEDIPPLSTPGSGSTLDDPQLVDRWLRSMWLSNEDFVGLFKTCIECSVAEVKGTCVILNGVSANTDSRWAVESTKDPVSFQPSSDCKAVTS